MQGSQPLCFQGLVGGLVKFIKILQLGLSQRCRVDGKGCNAPGLGVVEVSDQALARAKVGAAG